MNWTKSKESSTWNSHHLTGSSLCNIRIRVRMKQSARGGSSAYYSPMTWSGSVRMNLSQISINSFVCSTVGVCPWLKIKQHPLQCIYNWRFRCIWSSVTICEKPGTQWQHPDHMKIFVLSSNSKSNFVGIKGEIYNCCQTNNPKRKDCLFLN